MPGPAYQPIPFQPSHAAPREARSIDLTVPPFRSSFRSARQTLRGGLLRAAPALVFCDQCYCFTDSRGSIAADNPLANNASDSHRGANT